MCSLNNHRILSGGAYTEESVGQRIVVFARDQALPPGWRSTDAGCPAIIRIEFGSLRDIAEEVAAATRNWRLPAGSVIFLSSATELLGTGLGQYMANFCSLANWLEGVYSREVIILPGVPFIMDGSDSPQLVRALADMANWISNQSGDIKVVGEAFAKMKEILISSGVGGHQDPYPAWHWLADNAVPYEGAKHSAWGSMGGAPLSNGLAALSEREEQAILDCLVKGLKDHQNLELNLAGSSNRSLPQEVKSVHVLVVGATNSCRLAAAMEEMGITTGRVTTTNWKPSKESVEVLAAYVKSSVEGENPAAVVFQMHDNLLYMGQKIDGSTRQQFKDKMGWYHVEGDLVLAPKEVQANLYRLMKPILEAVGHKPFVVVTPMGRYVSSPCCENVEHVTNFREAEYGSNMERDLEEVRKNMRGYIFGDNVRRAVVLGPAPLMAKMGVDCCWADDPVHPLPAVYTELAKLVMSNLERLDDKVERFNAKAQRTGGSVRE